MKFCQSWKLVQIVKVGASLTVFGEKLSELFPSFPSAPFLSCPFLPVVLARSMKYSRHAESARGRSLSDRAYLQVVWIGYVKGPKHLCNSTKKRVNHSSMTMRALVRLLKKGARSCVGVTYQVGSGLHHHLPSKWCKIILEGGQQNTDIRSGNSLSPSRQTFCANHRR